MIDIDRTWDAIVIGAGLAGSVTATRLADAGARVLLVEAKRFPRPKTCGGCLNQRAIEGLRESGFADALTACQPASIDRIDLRHPGGSLVIPLPVGQGVTREILDQALLDEARLRGVQVLEGVRGKVSAEISEGLRSVELRGEGSQAVAKARLVLACDGLGHPSLAALPEFDTVVSPHSRAGVGAVIEGPAAGCDYGEGAIVMAVGRSGYVGMAVCEQGRLSIAAAFDPAALRDRSASELVDLTLAEVGAPGLPVSESLAWRGSPRLSQHTPRVASNRVLLVGDAAGYVEPFTGEGMAAAIEGAIAVTPIALEAIDAWQDGFAVRWQSAYTSSVRRSQMACRAIAWMLKRPLATRLGLGAAATAPAIGRAIAARVSAG